MKQLVLVAVMLLVATSVSAESATKTGDKKTLVTTRKVAAAKPIRLKTEDDKTLYGLGLVIARQLSVFELSPRELRIVRQGIYDGVKGKKPRVDFAKYSKKSVEMGIARRDARGKVLAARNAEFLKSVEEGDGVLKSATGVLYLSLKNGDGANPVDTDKVKFYQRATLLDGKEVESSYQRGEPDVGLLKESVPCLTEALKLMKPGGKARIVCPPETAFAKEGYGIIPPDAVLVFEVELLEILKADEVPK